MAHLWRALEIVAVGATALVGGIAAGLGAAWLLARLSRRYAEDDQIDTLIKPATPHFTATDDSLRVAAEERRRRADAVRRDSVRITTKDEPRDRLWRVK